MRQGPDEKINLPKYAKAMSVFVTLFFWATCIAIGHFIINAEPEKSITLLLVLGFCMPIVVRAVIGLIQQKHLGAEIDAKEIASLAIYGIFFTIAFFVFNFLLPFTITHQFYSP